MAKKADAFYAVRVGRQKGVYRTWDDCNKQVHGFPQAKYKKFNTLAEAEAFAGCSVTSVAALASSVSPVDADRQQEPVVFFYAVRAGRVPGIYNTWKDCWNQTDEYMGAEFKKFKTLSLAQAYLDQGPPAVNMGLPVGPIALSKSTSASSSTSTAPPAEELRIYTDGSCPDNVGAASTQGKAGWGFAVFSAPCRAPLDFYGPVVFDRSDPLFLGATCGTNNTGELSGIAMALCWLAEAAAKGPARILYDSTYAANLAQEKWKATQNVELVRNTQACRRAVVKSGRPLIFEKVKGHSGDAGNDRADRNADLGASGTSRVWTRPGDTPILPKGGPPILEALNSAKRKLPADARSVPPNKRARGDVAGISYLEGNKRSVPHKQAALILD